VNLAQRHYDCMVWDISGIPYKHGIRCILRERQDIDLYVHEAYTISSYLKIYDVMMHPIKNPVFRKQRQCPKLGPPQLNSQEGDHLVREDGTELRRRRNLAKTSP